MLHIWIDLVENGVVTVNWGGDLIVVVVVVLWFGRQVGRQAEGFGGGVEGIDQLVAGSGSEAIGAEQSRAGFVVGSWLLLSSRAARGYRGDLAAPHQVLDNLGKEDLVLADVRVVREDAKFSVLSFLRRG